MQEFQILGFPRGPAGVVSEVSARSCKAKRFKQWCEALSSVFSSSGGPSGSNSRFITNLYFRKLDLEISFIYLGLSGQDYLAF